MTATGRCALYHRVLDIEETGSGHRNDRPGLQKVMDAALRGLVNTVIVWRLERFGRSGLDIQVNIRSLQRANVTFPASAQALEIRPKADPITKVILAVMAAWGELESEVISERNPWDEEEEGPR